MCGISLSLVLCSVMLGLLGMGPAAAGQAGMTGAVEGEVVSYETGRPVPGATISLPDEGLTTTSRRDGYFSFSEVLRAAKPYREITAVVTAPGFGRWKISGAPLYPNDTLRLHAEMRTMAFDHQVAPPTARSDQQAQASPDEVTHNTCTGWDYQLVPPPTIKVFISDDGVSREYDFVFYVTHVLPNEWITSWDADSLGAGAIAVRTYAAYKTMSNHAYSGGPGCADVIDTSADQIFDPNYSTAATDQAVYATWGSILYKAGGLFLSQYYAGSPGQACAPVQGEFEGRMAQWGTQTCALQGKLWPTIVTTFYVNSYWNYLKNLILNPSASSAGMYPWLGGSGTEFERLSGTGYEGGWFIQQKPKVPGTNSTLYQHRAFNGTPSSQYHAEVALRCGTQNAQACTVTIRVVAFPATGKEVSRGKVVTVPRDNVWRVYEFDPSAHGITHKFARLSTVTTSTINVDAAFLSGPFGGP